MSGLTETEYRTLRTRTLAILGELGAADNATATAIAANLVPAVEAILRERVRDAQRQAWAEGYNAASDDAHSASLRATQNPHLGSVA